MYIHVTMFVPGSEDHFKKSLLSFNSLDSQDGTQVTRFNGHHLYPLCKVTGPGFNFNVKLIRIQN